MYSRHQNFEMYLKIKQKFTLKRLILKSLMTKLLLNINTSSFTIKIFSLTFPRNKKNRIIQSSTTLFVFTLLKNNIVDQPGVFVILDNKETFKEKCPTILTIIIVVVV